MTNYQKRKIVERLTENILFINNKPGSGLINELQKIKDSTTISSRMLDIEDFDSIKDEGSVLIFDEFHRSLLRVQVRLLENISNGKFENKTIVLVGNIDELNLDSALMNKFIII